MSKRSIVKRCGSRLGVGIGNPRLSGQATTEYILILLIAVSLSLFVTRQLLAPAMKRISDGLSKSLESRLFRPGTLHRFPIKR